MSCICIALHSALHLNTTNTQTCSDTEQWNNNFIVLNHHKNDKCSECGNIKTRHLSCLVLISQHSYHNPATLYKFLHPSNHIFCFSIMVSEIVCTPEAIRWLQESLEGIEAHVEQVEPAELGCQTPHSDTIRVCSRGRLFESMQASMDSDGAKFNIPKEAIPQYITIWNIRRIKHGRCKTLHS